LRLWNVLYVATLPLHFYTLLLSYSRINIP